MAENKKNILICGASIAGPCLAYWLNRAGFKTTVIERAPKFRDGGQNIDIIEPGKKIIDLMGLSAAIKAKNTSELGLRFVDSNGATVAEFPKGGENSFTRDTEILRGDLARIFYDATKDQTLYRFGLMVKSISENSDSVRVDFSDGTFENYDLIVSAEGNGSATRKLIMPEFVKMKYFGIWVAYFRIPKLTRDDNWARWHNAVGGHVILMRPSTKESESVSVDFPSHKPAADHQSLKDQRDKIRSVLEGIGWESQRISESLEYDDDLYMGPLSQVKASQWSKGRFVLVGDAAYGPSPLTGKGTTLAITGAYVLAGELAKSGDVLSAVASYERILRPYIEKCQQLPPGVPRIAPKNKIGNINSKYSGPSCRKQVLSSRVFFFEIEIKT